MKQRNLLGELFLTFAKIGLFTFGGGYAMLSLITDECVDRKKWLTHDEMMDLTVIAESTPGPIAINCATYVGWRQKGMAGAVAATLGMILPSFVILYLISRFLESVLEIKAVASAFRGIRCAVGILVLDAGVRMVKKMKKKALPAAILAASAAAMLGAEALGLSLSSVAVMLTAGAVSLVLFAVKEREAK